MTTSTQRQRVALCGLGLMGAGMARSLLRAGFPLTLYNRTREKTAAFEADGAKGSATPREAASQADVVISMVADDAASRSIWLGEQGALGGASPGTVFIEASTLTVPWIQELSAAARKAGCDLLDAPVTGSRVQADAGELCFLVGGSAAALEHARPVLEAMSRAVVPLGPQGSGCLMKLINNFLCGVQVASLAEAVALIEKSGLDADKAEELLSKGAPGSPLVNALIPRMRQRAFDDPHFHLALMAKDLEYALEEGSRHGKRLETAAAALKQFRQAIADGQGDKDFSSVVESLRRG